MELQVRRYESRDHDAMWYLNNHALDGVNAHPGQDYFSDLHQIQDVYLDAGGEFLVGTIDDQVVAMGAFKRTDESRAEIVRMRIHPDFQRRGFGQVILTALIDRAREAGYRALHLSTTVQQVAAQGLYERNGFLQSGTDTYEDFKLLLYEKQFS